MTNKKDKVMPVCAECGRLFTPKAGQLYCRQCAPAEEQTETSGNDPFRFIQVLADQLGLPAESVAEAAKNPDLHAAIPTPTIPSCKSCGSKSVMEGSNLCFECRVASFNDLGTAMKDVGSRVQRPKSLFGRPHGLAREALESRRESLPLPENKTPTIVQLRGGS